jgi:hypothetical protein
LKKKALQENVKLRHIKEQFERVMNLAALCSSEQTQFTLMCQQYYGDVHYSDVDEDLLIDCLDYGTCKISFEEFDKTMKKINAIKKQELKN